MIATMSRSRYKLGLPNHFINILRYCCYGNEEKISVLHNTPHHQNRWEAVQRRKSNALLVPVVVFSPVQFTIERQVTSAVR